MRLHKIKTTNVLTLLKALLKDLSDELANVYLLQVHDMHFISHLKSIL